MKVTRSLFPIGTALSLVGVAFAAELEHHSFDTTLDWKFSFLSDAFPICLLIGTIFVVVGSFFERRQRSPQDSRTFGIVSLIVCGVLVMCLASFGNVHGWSMSLVFPMVSSFIAGLVMLTARSS